MVVARLRPVRRSAAATLEVTRGRSAVRQSHRRRTGGSADRVGIESTFARRAYAAGMDDGSPTDIEWVVLTMGNRPQALDQAVRSIADATDGDCRVIVVANGAPDVAAPPVPGARLEVTDHNLGIPGGRDVGLRAGDATLVGFLDDDAVLLGDVAAIRNAFELDRRLGAVSLRIIDEDGHSTSRHVPRPGGGDPDVGGPVAHFLGGACAIRREAYEQVGGYFVGLFYGHEEIELGWRLIDAGWNIRYLADVQVFHPRTEIGRHDHGWRLTGRNRVWIARRTLPWPIAIVHVTVWLALGLVRAPGLRCRRSYVAGWIGGWRTHWADGSTRRPIAWRTVWRLTRLGRPPVV